MIVSTICKKKAFRDLKDAHSALNIIKRESDRFQIPSRAYFCEDCGNYHLTKYGKDYYRNKENVSETDLMGKVKNRLKLLIAKLQHEAEHQKQQDQEKQYDYTGRVASTV